jgi:hypothetical protein
MSKHSPNEWRGSVSPLETGLAFNLMVRPAADGSVDAFLRNPERNLGYHQFPVDRLELEDSVVRLIDGPLMRVAPSRRRGFVAGPPSWLEPV